VSKKKLEGKILSNKMQKTVVVGVEVIKEHPIYKKKITRTRRFFARDDLDSKVGDIVVMEEARPLGKRVTWRVLENLSSSAKNEEKKEK